MNVTIYARQSLDRTGEALAVSRQLDLCREFATERGWTITDELVDNDVSATTGARRPAFEQVVATGGHVLVWHIDRLIRLTRDLERVIDAGASVYAVKAGHIDLSNPAGRAVARTITAWATYEGEQKAERQKASNDQRAAAGIPAAGRRCYGYSKDGMTLIDEEAAYVRRAALAVLDGMPMRSIVRQMNEAGATTTAGNPWKPTELRRHLQRPRLAGHRVHRGEIVRRKGQWTPILTEDEHVAVSAILSDPSRKPKGRPRAYLLSGVGRCGVCGGRLYGRIEKRGPIYVCESGAHLGRKIADIDQYVEAVTVARLALPDARATFTTDDTEEVTALHRERAAIVARLDDLAESFAEDEITRRQMATATAKMNTRIAEIDSALPRLSTGPLTRILGHDDVQEVWQALDVETRREVVSELVGVTVGRAGRGARTFDPETVQIEWRTV